MEKKIMIGIITHYYKSVNYGGNLQAYALCRFLNEHGYYAQQIAFNRYKDNGCQKTIRTFCSKIYKTIKDLPNILKHYEVYKHIKERNKAFIAFRDIKIPHSQITYTEKTLNKLTKIYDVFITGSDQVWHPKAVCDAYLLNLHMSGLRKISYAASVATKQLTDIQKKRFKSALKDYTAISVREQDAVELIQPLSPIQVKWVIDPVFLLSKQTWDELCEQDTIKRPYIFCFFLGENTDMRCLAQEYAKQSNCELVTIPYLKGKYRRCDNGYGDITMYDVSPQKFITLIKHACYVFTDSFHAMAFSLIMQKEYFVFDRDVNGDMSSRIYSLSSIFGTQSHYCNSKSKLSLKYLTNVSEINYQTKFSKFEQMRIQSISFLLNNIR